MLVTLEKFEVDGVVDIIMSVVVDIRVEADVHLVVVVVKFVQVNAAVELLADAVELANGRVLVTETFKPVVSIDMLVPKVVDGIVV